MPNTLAHFGFQGVVTRALIKEAEAKWIFFGCIIPDLPWILHRAVRTLIPSVDLYHARLYAAVQASLAVSLLCCVSVALIAKKPYKVFRVLALNAFLHLLIDACQTKWANGVHLFAPFSWELVNFGWFWPESLPTILLTVLGLAYFAWEWRRSVPQLTTRGPLSSQRILMALVCLIAYLLLPLAFWSASYAKDNHSVQTLRERQSRVGRKVAFDHNQYLQRAQGDMLRTFTQETLRVTGDTRGRSGTISVRATFVDPETIRIDVLHQHWPWFRDSASYFGLTLLAALWIRSWWRESSLFPHNRL